MLVILISAELVQGRPHLLGRSLNSGTRDGCQQEAMILKYGEHMLTTSSWDCSGPCNNDMKEREREREKQNTKTNG